MFVWADSKKMEVLLRCYIGREARRDSIGYSWQVTVSSPKLTITSQWQLMNWVDFNCDSNISSPRFVGAIFQHLNFPGKQKIRKPLAKYILRDFARFRHWNHGDCYVLADSGVGNGV